MATAEVIDLYPSIPHNVGVQTIRGTLDDRVNTKIGTEDFIKMRQFVLKTATLNLMVKLNNSFLRLLSIPSLRLYMLVYL